MKQLYVNLAFKADTKAAEANLQKLRTTLSDISAMPFTTGTTISADLRQASTSAQELQRHLAAAMNVKTGNLDLNKFQASLNRSNQSLTGLTSNLLRAGTTGQQAFLSLHSAMAQSNIQINKATTLMGRFATTLKNTARWQLSSTLLTGVISTLSGAVSYAKELDKSLTNISIVTGFSRDTMAEFATQANKAAKALSTTTTAYADAALIYYQQGLRGDAVLERANTTVKLANVVGKSASEVSEWMTAIWNNFDDGKKSLEYYADAITALGAATASSSEEIATGLEKFAAVAETVGLSYEYATAALATVTAQTRQSADVVGTAFKTLFARMQDLKLGETLDDGTTLGQYSEAMYKVGVNIKTSSGELKDMNLILDELGAKWQNLDKDQQVALAKSVAGLRQYNQFIALMSNYDYMQQNVKVAEESEGTLQHQAEIYEQSWEGAKKHVKASFEGLVGELFPTDAVVDFTNGLSTVLDAITEIVDMFGGLKGIILLIGTLMVNKFQPQISSAIDAGIQKMTTFGSALKLAKANAGTQAYAAAKEDGKTSEEANKAAQNASKGFRSTMSAAGSMIKDKWNNSDVKNTFVAGRQLFKNANDSSKLKEAETTQAQRTDEKLSQQNAVQKEKSDSLNSAKTSAAYGEGGSAYFTQMVDTYKQVDDYTTKIANLKGQITEQEREQLSLQLEGMKNIGEELAKEQEISSELQKQKDMMRADTIANMDTSKLAIDKGMVLGHEDINQETDTVSTGVNKTMSYFEEAAINVGAKGEASTGDITYDSVSAAASGAGQSVEKLSQAASLQSEIADLVERAQRDEADIDKELEKIIQKRQEDKTLTEQMSQALKESVKGSGTMAEKGANLNKVTAGIKRGYEQVAKASGASTDSIKKAVSLGQQDAANKKKINTLQGKYNSSVSTMNKNLNSVVKSAQSFGNALTKGFSAASQMAMGLNMVVNALENMADGEISLANVSTLLMGVPMIISGVTSAFGMLSNALQGTITKQIMYNAVKKIANATEGEGIKKAAANIIAKQSEKGASDDVIKAKLTEMFVKQTGMTTDEAAAAASSALAASKGVETTAETMNTAGIWANTAAWYANPIMWIVAIILAVIAAIVALTCVLMDNSKEQNEVNESIAENAKKNVDAINSTRELAKSVSDLTEEYIKLKENGESTAEALKNITEQMPELIDKYKELQGTLGFDLDVAGLETMYDGFKKGIISADDLLEKQNELDDKTLKANIDESKRGLKAATDTMGYKLGEDGSGSVSGNTYTSNWGGYGNEGRVSEILKEEMGDFVTSSDELNVAVKVDTSNSKQMMEYYEKMVAAKARLEKEESAENLADSGIYAELKEDIEAMAESYEKAKELADEYFVSIKEGFDADYGKELFASQEISGLDDYEQKRTAIISKLKEKYKDLTDTQIEGLLESSEYFKQYEQQLALFEEGSTLRTQIDNNFKLDIEEVKKWYNEIPEEDRTLFVGLDFTTIGSKEQMFEEMEKLREQAARTEILNEATALEVDESEFKMYSQLISKHSEKLSENKVLADQTALAHYKLNKGLSALSEKWEDNVKILKKSAGATPEYAKALGEVSKALEDAFGVPVSSDFITKNLEQITKVAEGDTSALQELQDKLAEDYVANMVIGEVSINDNAAVAVDTARQTLQDMLNDLDTSIEIGEGSTLSDTYLETLQQMLDAGQITEEQLQNMMRAKGFEFEITGWKEVDGPEKTIKRTSYNEDTGDTETYTITEQEKMQVPIINGKGDAIKGTASKPQAVRTVNEQAVNYTNTNKEEVTKQAADNKKTIESLKDEKDRYADINEQLSDMSDKLEQIRKAKNRAFGKDKIKAIHEERNALKQEVDVLKDKEKRLEKDTKERYNDISKYGYAFNSETGAIVNSNEVYDKMLKKYEAGLAQAGTDEEARKQWEDWWNKFVEDTKKYTDTLNDKESVAKEIADKTEELLDLDYEELEYKIEIKLQVQDWGLKTLERRLKNIEDDAFAAAEAIEIMGKQADKYSEQFKINQKGIEDLLKMKGANDKQIKAFMSGDSSAISNLKLGEQDFEKLNEFREGMSEALDNMETVFDSIFEKMNEVFDAINEKFDSVTEKLEHAKSIVDSMSNIIDLVGSTNLGFSKQMVMDMADATLDLAKTQIATATAQKNKNQEMLQQAKEGLAAATTDAEKKKWQDSIDYYEEQVRENEQAWLNSLSSALEAGSTRRQKAVEQALEGFLQETMGYKSMDDLMRARNYSNQNADLYVKQYEKAYQLSKLTRDIEKKIDSVDSIGEKQKLLKLEEKINKAKEAGVEMSKYEVEALQREYDIEVAKIALAEAQNAKSQVRLTRNAEGGMSYVYTADQDKTSEAEQGLETAIYNATKANDEWIRSIEDGMLKATETFMTQLQVINTTVYDSEAERNAAMDELNEWYYGNQLPFYASQMDTTLSNNESLYKNHIETINADYGTMDGYNASNLASFQAMYTSMYKSGNDFATSLKDTTLPSIKGSLIGDSNSMTAYVKTLSTKLGTLTTDKDGNYTGGKGLYGDLADAQKSYETFVIGSFEAAGLSIGDEGFAGNIKALAAEDGTAVTNLNQFQSFVSKYIGDGTDGTSGVKKIISEANKEIKTLQEKTDFTKARDNAKDYGAQVAQKMNEANTAILGVNTSLQTLIDKWGNVEQLQDIEKEINIKINYTKGDIPDPDTGDNSSSNGGGNSTYSGSGVSGEQNKWKDKFMDLSDANIDLNSYGYNGSKFGQVKNVRKNEDTGEYEYKFVNNNTGEETWFTDSQLQASTKKAGTLINDKSGVQTDKGDFSMKNSKGTYNDYVKGSDNIYYQLSSADDQYTNWNRINENEGIFYADDSNTWKDMTVYKPGEYIDYGYTTIKGKDGKDEEVKLFYIKGQKKWMKVSKNNPSENGFMYDQNNKQIAWHRPKDAEVKSLSFSDVINGKDGIYWASKNDSGKKIIFKDGHLIELFKTGGWNYIMMSDVGGYTYNSKVGEAVWANPKHALFKLGVKDGGLYDYYESWDYNEQEMAQKGKKYFESMFRTSDNKGFEFEVDGWNKKITIDEMLGKLDKKGNGGIGVASGKIGLGFNRVYKFDTGGYTGEWGPEGRIALLHQKEIVLNAHDTENLLSIVDMVRQMATSLDFNALSMANGLASFLTTANINTTSAQQLDQNVSIIAEFPNATDKDQIKEAFGDLVNLAAQYANRK